MKLVAHQALLLLSMASLTAPISARVLREAFAINARRATPSLLSAFRRQRNGADTARRGLSSLASAVRSVDQAETATPTMTEPSSLPPTERIKGVIFDMDGTLVKPCIDFADMRRRVYDVATADFAREVTEGCVLEIHDCLSDEGRSLCREIFTDIEEKSIEEMALMDGLLGLCGFLDERGIRRAVLTRNVRRSVDAMHELMNERNRGMEIDTNPFHPAVARDTTDENDLALRAKPEPDGIHYICRRWNCDPGDVIVVGDSDKDDIVAAYRAGCGGSVLLVEPGRPHDNDAGTDGHSHPSEREPTVQVAGLSHLHDLLSENMGN